VFGCTHVRDDPEQRILGSDDLARRDRKQLVYRLIAQPLADLREGAVDRWFEAGEVAAVIAVDAQVERGVLDFSQRRLNLRRGQIRKRCLEQRIAFSNAEDFGSEPFRTADETVQKHGAPGEFV